MRSWRTRLLDFLALPFVQPKVRIEQRSAMISNNPISIEKPFIISRTFSVHRERMWKEWTERDRLMQWFGPKAFKMPVAKMDLRPGGTFH
jgi:hypothetical protein